MKPDGAPGVSWTVKTSVVVGLALAALVIWLVARGGKDATPANAEPAAPAAPAAKTAEAKPRPPQKVQRVTPEERKQLAARIRDARAGRAAISAPAGPSLPSAETPPPKLPDQPPALDPGNLPEFKTTFKAAMKEVVPYLAECYDKATALPDSIEVFAKLSLTGDPDIGTLIDTDGLTGKEGAPLQAEFDLCVRDALAGLQLPPLTEGEQVQVNYPFVFTR